MEIVRVSTGEEAEQRVNVWLWERDEYSEWSVIAIQGPLTAFGRFSEYGVLPGAVTCKRCGESHVKGCRSRFLPVCFRWTDTVRHRRGQDDNPMWMLCETVECGQLPVGEVCVCGRKRRLVLDFGSGMAVKSFDVTRVMEHRRNWFRCVPNIPQCVTTFWWVGRAFRQSPGVFNRRCVPTWSQWGTTDRCSIDSFQNI
jgi:hypothetical protein